MSGDPASIFSSCSILHYWLWQEEEEEVEERLRQTERLKEVNAATIRFFLEFDWLFKEENPLITGHLTGIADELDKVIMKATMAKWSIFSFCVPECDRYLKRLQTVKKEILSMRRLDTCRLFGFFHREEEEKLREAIEETIRFFKECDGWFKEENPLIAGHLAGMKVIMKAIMAKQRLFRIRVGTLDNYTFKKRLHSEVALQEWKYPNSNEQ
ncbi:hypothetical protein AOXY_G27081 [Acipenser oxyrinchus oxyrinchus]|uniref:Uncharacterized protein n=1 Tax=Acipenser oxyrinchus oxyrinchus TaxID=40147 RepID=A0AAD8CPA4_ACIOX|nr:hypothetical protein AOXY_G27081 [Acipenser oxyrinchus oxyrinchus]